MALLRFNGGRCGLLDLRDLILFVLLKSSVYFPSLQLFENHYLVQFLKNIYRELLEILKYRQKIDLQILLPYMKVETTTSGSIYRFVKVVVYYDL